MDRKAGSRKNASGVGPGTRDVHLSGRKRHLLVDTLGLLVAVLVTAAGTDDGARGTETRGANRTGGLPPAGSHFRRQ